MMTETLLAQLDCVKLRGRGKYIARCPSHSDRNPSLSIREADDRILLHCFGGCKPEEIVAALRLEMRDLFMDSPISQGQRPAPTPQKLNLVAVAFRFELAALDRRLRADHVLRAATAFPIDTLSAPQLDRLLNAVACAYADKDRAEFLETMADGIRLKALHERTESYAA